MSKVSVVVPIYNAAKELHKCIKSILKQTFKEIEVILVNDGSTDDSLKICKHYQKQDKRIIVIDKENEGSIKTRRIGVEISNSELVMFVDADDWIDRRIIETLYKELIDYSVDIVVCNTYKVLGNGFLVKQKNKSQYFSKDKIYSDEEIKKELVVAYLHGHPFPAGLVAKLYKKEFLLNSGKLLEKIRFFGDDLFYNLEIFLKVKRVKVINNPLYYYRSGGFTSKYMPFLFDDMTNGFQIQKKIIEQYYQNTREHQYKGISLMLLNTFQTSLYNLFNSDFDEKKIKSLIKTYVCNEDIIECTFNKDSINYFSEEYLKAIRTKNVEYLYELGKNIYIKKKPKKQLISLIAKLHIV
jgi:glycosyltransferase involved in cell wall biosynthesis